MKRLLASLVVLHACSLASAQTTAPAPPVPRLPVAPVQDSPNLENEVEYIRYLGSSVDAAAIEATPDRLQTAVVRFEKDGTVIDLVGVVHLGDAVYYEALNERLKGYDAVLYEMVGGPHQPGEALPEGAIAEEMGSIRQLQQLAKSFLGLEFQLDGIDYTAPNFIHADVAWTEFTSLMEARNETIMTLFTRAISLAEGGEIAGIPNDEAAMEAMMKRIFNAVLTGNSGELKRSIAPLLSEAEGFITRLEGDDGTVIVSERNRVVMEKLAEVRAAKGRGEYAIFYGAGHMPDLEKRLLADGFVKRETVWLDAWSIPAGGVATSPTGSPTGSPAEMLIRLLSENPEVMTGLQDLGTMLEDLGGTIKALKPPQPVP